MGGQEVVINSGTLLARIAHENLREAQVNAGAFADQRAIARNEFDQALADRPATEQTEFVVPNRHIFSARTGLAP